MTIVSVGIDCASGQSACTYAALDHELRLIQLSQAELDELFGFLAGHDSAFVAVNAPSRTNSGIVRQRLQPHVAVAGALRGGDLREAEHELRLRGIPVSGTPRNQALCPTWVKVGFQIFRRLADLGFVPFQTPGARRQWMETHPHAAFCVLLGRHPLPKPTLEGRLQRALVLFERGVRIQDPMAFLEEITRHRLLNGLLPMDSVLTQEQLDALVAAFTAWMAAERRADVIQLGNPEEGFISLPGAHLLDEY